MAEIVNLNKFRKERDRVQAKAKAAENRAAKGQPKYARTKLQIELEKARKALDQHKRDD